MFAWAFSLNNRSEDSRPLDYLL